MWSTFIESDIAKLNHRRNLQEMQLLFRAVIFLGKVRFASAARLKQLAADNPLEDYLN